MIRSEHRLGRPFLLVEGSAAVGWRSDAREVVQVVLRPGLSDFLGDEVLACTDGARRVLAGRLVVKLAWR